MCRKHKQPILTEVPNIFRGKTFVWGEPKQRKSFQNHGYCVSSNRKKKTGPKNKFFIVSRSWTNLWDRAREFTEEENSSLELWQPKKKKKKKDQTLEKKRKGLEK